MVASPELMAGGGAVVVLVLVLVILLRGRRRRAAARAHEAYLDGLTRGSVAPVSPVIEAILVPDDELFAAPPPALPRRVETAAPAPEAAAPPAPEPVPEPPTVA